MRVQGIKPAVAVVEYDDAPSGQACVLQTVTFDGEGRTTVTALDLTLDEASRLVDALQLAVTQTRARDVARAREAGR